MNNTAQFAYQIAYGLAELRRSRRVTQEKLATMLGTKQSVISRIESGAATPSWEFIDRIMEALHAEVEIVFKLVDSQALTTNRRFTGQEYICVNCLYRWESRLNRSVIQCPRCRKMQGVLFSEYTETVQAFQDLQREVKKSPPFRKLPPLRSLKKNSPQVLKLILEVAGKTFPSPRLPVSLLFRILEQSRQKPVENQPAGVKNTVLPAEES